MKSAILVFLIVLSFKTEAQEWTMLSDFPGQTRSWGVTFIVGDYAYYGAGFNETDFWKYNPHLDQWDIISPFPEGARKNNAVFTVNQMGYLGLGNTSCPGCYGNNNLDVWQYDPSSDSWNIITALPGNFSTENSNYGFGFGFSAFLINEDGKVARYDPTCEEVITITSDPFLPNTIEAKSEIIIPSQVLVINPPSVGEEIILSTTSCGN